MRHLGAFTVVSDDTGPAGASTRYVLLKGEEGKCES
jgi:hypothetical protein